MQDCAALDATCINTIRTLSMDAVQAASSGHPGTPMALAPVAYCLWQHFLRFDPQEPILYRQGDGPFVTDNGNHILDCQIEPISDALRLEMDIRAIPGVVGTGLFLAMAETVLVGDRDSFQLLEERRRGPL